MQCLFAVQRQAKPCLASPGTAFPKAVHKVIHRNRGQEKNRLKNQELGLRTGPWGRAAQHAPSSKAGRCKGLDKAGKGKLCTEAILVSRGISACTARLKNRNTLSQAFELKKFFCLFRVGGKFSQPLQKCARLQDVNKVIHRTLAGKKSFLPVASSAAQWAPALPAPCLFWPCGPPFPGAPFAHVHPLCLRLVLIHA